jgi:hypothetical protein
MRKDGGNSIVVDEAIFMAGRDEKVLCGGGGLVGQM